jgi:hypothetical protein
LLDKDLAGRASGNGGEVSGDDFLQLLKLLRGVVGEPYAGPGRIAPDNLTGEGYYFSLEAFPDGDGQMTFFVHRQLFAYRKITTAHTDICYSADVICVDLKQ